VKQLLSTLNVLLPRPARQITRWFDEAEVALVHREQVIEQACLHPANTEELDLGLQGAHLPDIPLDEVIRLFRPAFLEPNMALPLARLVQWPAEWTSHGILDDRVRARALELARGERTHS
jgi:hypothetical protein